MIEKLQEFLEKHRSLIQYMMVGGVGMLVDNAFLYVLVESISIDVTIGKILSAEAAIISNFLINDFWTFRDHNVDTILERLFKSNLIRVGGVAVALVILKVLYEGFSVPLVIANSIGIFLGFVFNYGLENLYTWKTHRKLE